LAKFLPGILCAFRTTPATESTTLSPYFLLFGREANLPLDSALLPNKLSQSSQQHIENICKSLEIGQNIARQNIERAQAKYSKQYNKKTAQPEYKVGDKVMVKVKHVPFGVRSKLYKKYTGPYYICLVHDNFTYTLRKCSDNMLLTVPIHANRLKAFVSGLEVKELQGDIYFVERIVQCKGVKGKKLYLIKWRGYKEKTWEPVDNLPEWLVHEYHRVHTVSGRPRKRGHRV
jgi:Chromo (CHRromatin Organisation MOdifier) domain